MRCSNVLIVVFLTGIWAFGQNTSRQTAVSPDIQAALGHIRAASLRADLSFLASDLLEGRDSPSRGLDIAAEYIAAQFQIAGLEPGVGGRLFSKRAHAGGQPSLANFDVKISRGGREISLRPSDVVLRVDAELDLRKRRYSNWIWRTRR